MYVCSEIFDFENITRKILIFQMQYDFLKFLKNNNYIMRKNSKLYRVENTNNDKQIWQEQHFDLKSDEVEHINQITSKKPRKQDSKNPRNITFLVEQPQSLGCNCTHLCKGKLPCTMASRRAPPRSEGMVSAREISAETRTI